MNGAPPTLTILFSQVPCFDGRCVLALINKTSHIRLIRGFGALSTNALDVLGWAYVLSEKPPLMVPNYSHQGNACTLYIFDTTVDDYSKFIDTLMAKGLLQTFIDGVGATSEEDFREFMKSL